MDDEIHDLDDQIHDDLVLASLLAEDGHPAAARRMLDRPRRRLRAVRDRVEAVVADAAVERAAEEALAGCEPRTAPRPERGAVAMRAAMAALVWLAAALVAFDAPSLEILGSETEAPAVTSDRVRSGHAGLTPPDRRVEDPDAGERSASPPVPRGPAVAERSVTTTGPPSTHRDDAGGGSLDDGDGLLGLDLAVTDDQIDDLVDVPDDLLGRIIEAGRDVGGTERDEDAPADPDGSDESEDDEDDGDDGGSGVLPGDGADDRHGTGSTGSLP